MENCKHSANLLSLPPEILQNILSFCTYDEVARHRQICKRFNDNCRMVLNRSRNKLMIKYKQDFETEMAKQAPEPQAPLNLHWSYAEHFKKLKQVKWHLNRLCDAYDRHLQPEDRCFVAGKILDMLVTFLKRALAPICNWQAMKEWLELKKACQLAKEHFEDHVLPLLPNSELTLFRFSLGQSSSSRNPNVNSMSCKNRLLNLTPEVRQRIFSFLPFHDISKLRQVCQTLNVECQKTLNEGIVSAMEAVAKRIIGFRAICPGKYSCFNVILLETWRLLYTELDRLYHSYASAHEHKRSCFIAGKLIDETNGFGLEMHSAFYHTYANAHEHKSSCFIAGKLISHLINDFRLEVHSDNVLNKVMEIVFKMEAVTEKMKKARKHFKHKIFII